MPVSLALTGPLAAAVHGLDGFGDLDWSARWCSPYRANHRPGVIRTRRWEDPVLIGDVAVAPVSIVLRHLDTVRRRSGMAPDDRIELAVEHALRDRKTTIAALRAAGGSHPGDLLLRAVLRRRGHEPPTESYAETRAVQLLRRLGYRAWRQLAVLDGNRVVHRVDLVVPTRPSSRRPEVLRPEHGVLIEIDGRSVHEPQFERDHRRQTTYDALGFVWSSFTPTQVEHEAKHVARALAHAVLRHQALHRRAGPG